MRDEDLSVALTACSWYKITVLGFFLADTELPASRLDQLRLMNRSGGSFSLEPSAAFRGSDGTRLAHSMKHCAIVRRHHNVFYGVLPWIS